MYTVNKQEVANRLRIILGLLGDESEYQDKIADCAQRLHVSGDDLRASIDFEAPHPVVGVITAVVLGYGVDPTWLITGEYDGGTHHRALQGSPADAESLVQLVMSRSTPPKSSPPAEPIGGGTSRRRG